MSLLPFYSVVIPTYNRVQKLKKAVDSVLSQSYENLELIVVDNHSDDGTYEFLQSYDDDRLRVFRVHNHGVIAHSRNEGLRNARGEFVAFLDSDDWWVPNKLEIVKQFTEKSDLIYHNMWRVKSDTESKHSLMETREIKEDEVPFESLLSKGNAVINSSVVVKKSILEKIDLISEDKELIALEDFDCWIRCAREGARFKFLNQVLGYYWDGGGNYSNPERTLKGCLKLREKYYADKGLPLWLVYSIARSSFQLGKMDIAKPYLKVLIREARLFSMEKLKGAYMLLMISLKKVG